MRSEKNITEEAVIKALQDYSSSLDSDHSQTPQANAACLSSSQLIVLAKFRCVRLNMGSFDAAARYADKAACGLSLPVQI